MLRMALLVICVFVSPYIAFSQLQLQQTKPSGYKSMRMVSSDEKRYIVEFELTQVPNLHKGPIASFPRIERTDQGDWYICKELSREVEVTGAGEFVRSYGEPLVGSCGPGIGFACPTSPNPDNYRLGYGYESWDDPVFGAQTTIKARVEIMAVKDPVKAKCPTFEQEFRTKFVFGSSMFWYRVDGHVSEDNNIRHFQDLSIPAHQPPQRYCTNKLVITGQGGTSGYNVSGWGDTGPQISLDAMGGGLAGGSNIYASLYVRFSPIFNDKLYGPDISENKGLEAEVRQQLGCTAAPAKKWGQYPPAFIKQRTLGPNTVQFYYEDRYE
jgi:hypothetical protein